MPRPPISATNCWILTVVDAPIGSSILKATDLLTLRCRRLYWLLNSRAPNFKKLNRDDVVVFYVGGIEGGSFRGTCRLSSKPRRLPPNVKRHIIEDAEDKFDYYVNLREVELFPSPKPLTQIAKRLSFIKDKGRWWRNLQGGIIRIPERDFAFLRVGGTGEVLSP